MLLNLSKIRTAHERIDKVYPPEAFTGDQADYRVAEPVALALDVYKDKADYRLVGTLRTTLELPCSRCLEPFRLPVDARFDLRYQPLTEAAIDAEHELKHEDDFTSAYYENEQIDLEQLMREQFELALPMKPLCTPDCKGLCPSCGTNLNRATCHCTHEWEDPRFAALKAFTTKNTRGES